MVDWKLLLYVILYVTPMPGRVTRETLYGEVIYPDELPHKRGNMAIWSSLFIVVFTMAMGFEGTFNHDLMKERGKYISFLITLVMYQCLGIVLQIIKRFQYYAEERYHIASRYNGSHLNLLKKLFTFTTFSWIFIFICIFSGICIFLLEYDIQYHIRSISLCQFIGVIVFHDQLVSIVNLNKNPIHDSVFLENLHRLDYGSGMALNFFHGYLRLCLPHTGDQEKGIQERIDDYISRQRLSDESFPVRKLFVLIPSSTYIPNDLRDASFGWMENAGNLQEQMKCRAGVKDRVYKNTVYRIKDPENSYDKGVYVVAEGATPCKSLYDGERCSGKWKEFYKDHQKEIVFNFYETLREILREDRDCRDLCEFIYYVDTDEFGLNNVNVAKLILQRIYELQREEDYLKDVRDRNV